MTENPRGLCFTAGSCLPRGDGSYVVQPGRPIARLTPEQFGVELGVSASSVRRYIHEGLVPSEMVECAGRRKLLIRAEALAAVRAVFRTRME
jgi:hypothetical protein